MKGITHLSILRGAFLALALSSLPSVAGFRDWLSKKLPYKLPPEKLQFASLRPESAVEVLDRDGQRLFYLSGPKLRFYKALSEIKSQMDLDGIEAELTDQFGEIPEPVVNLMGLMLIRKQCK